MADLIRESPLGQVIRLVTRNRVLKYPEEEPGFQVPWEVVANEIVAEKLGDVPESPDSELEPGEKDLDTADHSFDHAANEKDVEHGGELARRATTRGTTNSDVARRATTHRTRTSGSLGARTSLTRTRTREQTRPYSAERFETEQEEAIERKQSSIIIPQKTSDGITLVDWYTTDDPANPQNWGSGKKAYIGLQIFLYTFAVYAGSAIYTSSEPAIMRVFGVGQAKASLGLSMYVIGYGVGPLLFSPLSEVPTFGRNVPYMASFALFVILGFPTATVENYAGLLVLRFLTGFMGSPCLATGAATMQDIVCTDVPGS